MNELVLAKCREVVALLEKEREDVKEMLGAVSTSMSKIDPKTFEAQVADAERNAWKVIANDLKANPPKGVVNWIESLVAATFRSSGCHIATTFPFGLAIPSEAEKEHLERVALSLRRKFF